MQKHKAHMNLINTYTLDKIKHIYTQKKNSVPIPQLPSTDNFPNAKGGEEFLLKYSKTH